MGKKALSIVGVQKNSAGTIQKYKLSDGRIIDSSYAVDMVSSGELKGYNVATAKDGTKSIRSNPDSDSSNNLDSLPTF